MTGKVNQVILIPVLILSCLLLMTPVSYAGVLNGHADAFNDGNGPAAGAWTGSAPFSNTAGLMGTIDFAVFTAADFNANFAGLGYVPGDALVYTYQVNVDPASAHFVSAEIVGISNPANTIGSFDIGVQNASNAFFDLGGNANWEFSPEIVAGSNSWGLAFSSPQAPINGASITVNGGTIAQAIGIPTPGPTAIPEPASFVLLTAGLCGLLLSQRRRRS